MSLQEPKISAENSKFPTEIGIVKGKWNRSAIYKLISKIEKKSYPKLKTKDQRK